MSDTKLTTLDVETAGGLKVAGTAITATPAELNALDGITSTVAELNILDGVTSTAAELNILDGVTSTASELNILDGVTATATELNYLDIATLGTGAASKAVVLDAGDDYTWPSAGVLTYGVLNDGTTALAATALEINRAADVSTRLIAAGATLAVTVAAHDGKTVLLDTAGGSVCTLPVAAATGARIRFAVTVRPSGGSHVIKVGNASDFLAGQINILDLDLAAQAAYQGDGSADDTITINNTTTGGAIGDYVELEDTLANVWTVVHGQLSVPAGSNVADPFSATV